MGWFKSRYLEIILLLCVTFISQGQRLEHFYGGSFSYKIHNNTDGKYMIEIELITGWELGKGPCGRNCTKHDVGRSTNETRQQMLTEHDLSWFGTYNADGKVNGNHKVRDMNTIVLSNFTEKVIAISMRAKWEQTLLKSTFELSKEYDGDYDLNYEGHSWIRLPLQINASDPNFDLFWHFQTKVTTRIRNDTGQTNRCPRTFARPVYRVKLDEVSKIAISAIDADGDLIKCHMAQFVEGGYISQHLPPGVAVKTDIETAADSNDMIQQCVVFINASRQNGYTNDTWIALPIGLNDYNKDTIQYGSELLTTATSSLSLITVQFTVNVLENLETPVFVPPTKEQNHRFIIYANSRWETDVYAQSPLNTTLEEFFVFGLDNEDFKTSSPLLEDEDRTKHQTVSWTPSVSQVGEHLCCIRAVDNRGWDSDQDRCFKLEVRPDVFTHSYAHNTARPYFVKVPLPDQFVECDLKATCFVPLYVHSLLELQYIKLVDTYTEKSAIGPIENKTLDGEIVYTSVLSFSDSIIGRPQLCLVASDITGQTSEKVCINSEILPPNPCFSAPCRNSNECRNNRTTGTFVCVCSEKFSGKFCENKIDLCKPQPWRCVSSNTNQCSHVPPYEPYCSCKEGFFGKLCEININDCRNDSCNHRGSCLDLVKNVSCQCLKRYSGERCEVDLCPNVTAGSYSCPQVGCENDPCHGNGICSAGGVCTCSSGYLSDQVCSTAQGHIAVNGIKFVPPSPKDGSQLTCYQNRSTVVDCHLFLAIVTQSGLKPTLTATSSSNLTVVPGAVSNTVIFNGINNIFSSDVVISGQILKQQGDYICFSAKEGVSSAELCIELTFLQDPKVDPNSIESIQQSATVKFLNPTLVSGSSILAYKNERYTLVLFTSRISQCEDLISTTTELSVFHAIDTGGRCISEVTFTFTSIGVIDVCLQSAKANFQQRCFKVNVIARETDPCSKFPCQNNGHCFINKEGGYTCICQENYQGINCQKGPCPTNDCSNNAFCEINDGKNICVCKAGYTGSKCNSPYTSTISEIPSFYGAARPKLFQCVVFQPCSVALLVEGIYSTEQTRVIVPGYVSSDMLVDDIELVHPAITNYTYQVNIMLKAQRVGFQDVCIQTKDQQGVNTDEICMKIIVTADVSSVYGFQDRPHFVSPSLPMNANVECGLGDQCHVIYTIESGTDAGYGHCVSVMARAVGGMPTYKLYTTCDQCTGKITTSTHCTADLSIFTTETDIGRNQTFCLGLQLQGSEEMGEERCFTLFAVNTSSFKEPSACQKLHCQNDGFCDGHISSSPVCYCRSGFSGSQCENTPGNISPTSSSKPQSLYGDMVVPSIIECRLKSKCLVPIQIMSSGTQPPTLSLGYTDPRIIVDAPVVSSSRLSGVFSGSSVVYTCSEGTFKACFQTIDNSKIIDEVCLVIHVTGVPDIPVDPMKPFFLSPTLPKDSTVVCIVNNMCHFDMHFTKEVNHSNGSSQCPVLTETSNPALTGIHIFNSEKHTDDCSSDVLYLPKTASDNNVLCTQVSLPGNKGESRCFNIKVVANTSAKELSPCVGVICQHGGKCVANLNNNVANCICARGFEGANCHIAVNISTDLPGVSLLPYGMTGITQHFDGNSGVLKDMKCDTANPCCFSLPYHGSKDHPPKSGFRSAEITNVSTKVLVHDDLNIAVTCVTGQQGQHRICQQTTTNGTEQGVNIDEICFNINMTSGGVAGQTNSTKRPDFENIPPGSRVVCQPSSICHIPVISDKKSGQCEQVRECGEGMAGVNVFQTSTSGDKCITDIAIKTGVDGTTSSLCISAGTDGGTKHVTIATENNNGFGPCQKKHCLNGGTCFAISSEIAECKCTDEFQGITCQTEKSPCETITCENGGFCDGSNRSFPFCYCQRGFVGRRCEQAESSILPQNSTKSQSFFSDLVIPAQIVCVLGQPCAIPLQIKTNGTLPTLSLGYVDPRIAVEEAHVSRTQVDTVFSVTPNVQTKTLGQFKACLQLIQFSSVVDELCMNIKVTGVPSNPQNNTKPFYLPPTLLDGAIVFCLVGKICYFDMHFSKGPAVDNNEHCPDLTDTSNPRFNGVHIFESKSNADDCSSDVSYMPTYADVRTLCVQVEHPGMKGETRCYKIMVQQDLSKVIAPCVGIICKNGGKCLARFDLSPAEGGCMCAHGFIGTDCGKNVNTTTNLPGLSGVSEGSQHFDSESGVPLDIKCDTVNPCCISLPYHGSKNNPPINGFISPAIFNISTYVISPPTNKSDFHIAVICVHGNPGQHRMCQQTTTDGTKQGVNVDEICYNIEITSAGQKNSSLETEFKNIPAGSTVVCQPNTVCHIPIISEKKSGNCEQVRDCGKGLAGVHVFSTIVYGDVCVTDIAVKTGVVETSENLCVAAGFGGENKTILVSTQNKTGFGPCQKLHCLNGGRCMAMTNISAVCQCSPCFNGTTCEKEAVDVFSQDCKNQSVSTELPTTPDQNSTLSTINNTAVLSTLPSSTTNSVESSAGLEKNTIISTTLRYDCNTTKAAEHARKMVSSGYASCFCFVNGTKIHIIKKKPVVAKATMAKTAAFGAGGMTGSIGVGGVIYALVNKFRQPSSTLKKQVSSPTPRGRVHPQPAAKIVNPLHAKNVLSF